MTVGVPSTAVKVTPTASIGPPSGASVRRLVLRRVAIAPVILLGVSLAIFVLIDLSPNDPATARLGIFTSAEARAQFAAQHGLDDPLLIRYWRFLLDLGKFDFGESTVRSESVHELMARAMPISFQLMVLSVLLAVAFALTLGILAAWKEGTWADRAIGAAVAIIHATPEFWIGLLFIQLFAVTLGIVPSGGYAPISDGLMVWLSSMIGPAVVLSLGIMAALTRMVRASMADELAKDYVVTARGTGLAWPTVLFRNVLRNALITPITVLGITIGSLMSGAVLVEFVFNIPGMGSLLVNGIESGDLSIVRGVAIVAASAFIVTNMLVDVLYVILNPKSAEAGTE